ncbi:MAG: hypothetical protein V1897_10605 [Pseudomonadota bacterium]
MILGNTRSSFGKPPLIYALVDLQGKRTFFVRIINAEGVELKPGDKAKLSVFDIDPVPQEVVEIPRVFTLSSH